MSEVKLFYHKDNTIRVSRSIEFLKTTPIKNFLWIDLNNVDEEIENELEEYLKIYIQEEEEMIEIEMSSRYIETADSLVVNMNFILNNFEREPISFILKNNILITVRSEELASFHETITKLFANPKNYPTGYHVFIALLETRVEMDADMVERMTQQITSLSNNMTMKQANEELLLEIKDLQEKTMLLRENIIDKQRAVSNMLKSELIPRELSARLTILVKDINSLIEHIRFGFDRLDYLQDTFLAYVNVEQNKIIKMFTVISVIFMPPTLIASIYGMNFRSMPELDWEFGYLLSLFVMILSVAIILVIFKRKKWL